MPIIRFHDYNDATQLVWRQRLSKTPIFDDGLQRIEGGSAAGKEVSHGAVEQVIVVWWWRKIGEEEIQFALMRAALSYQRSADFRLVKAAG